MLYYGTRLSENISRREPEGYLLCLNVPVARCGVQHYLPGELGVQGSGMVPVLRPPEEVFSPACMASFEGMPVTNDHPEEGVSLENIGLLQKGHAHNVRRGSGKDSDLLLADLMITDEELIRAILGGKREISCGYTYDLSEENGQYVQRKIRGNHVAVVDAGRAGHRVSIRDRKPAPDKTTLADTAKERSMEMKNKKTIARVLARMARDGDTEGVAEVLEELLETPTQPEAEETPAETPAETAVIAVPEGQTVTIDSETGAAILERLDRLIALLSAAAETLPPQADEDPAEEVSEAVEELLEAAAAPDEGLAEIIESIQDPISAILEPEEETPAESPQAADALRAAIRTIRPALAKMPKRERARVCAQIADRMRSGRDTADSRGVISALARSRRGSEDPGELGRRIMAARNINQRK